MNTDLRGSFVYTVKNPRFSVFICVAKPFYCSLEQTDRQVETESRRNNMVFVKETIQMANREGTMMSRSISTPVILWPEAQPDRSRMGGKAATLATLSRSCSVPAWFVIPPETDIAQRQAEIISALTRLDADPAARFAVRSSAVAEDGTSASFAGQLESYLNVPAHDVLTRVEAVRRSGNAAHVQEYRRLRSQPATEPELEMLFPAVLVQRMVAAEAAGVAFGADPVTGDRTICTVSAVHGLADQLVSGVVNGDTYRTDRNGTIQTQTLAEEVPVLLPSQVRTIVELLTHVETEMGSAQDIEWAFADDRLYLLQARPITTLTIAPITDTKRTAENGPSSRQTLFSQQTLGGLGTVDSKQVAGRILWDNSNIVESYSGITSPLTFSFASHVYEHVYIAFCRLMGVAEAKVEGERPAFQNMLGHINGHVYYNLLNWYRVLALFPGFQMNRRFMEQMMGVKEPLPDDLLGTVVLRQANRWERLVDGARLARAGMGLVRSQMELDRTIRRFYARLDDALALSTETIQTLNLPRLLAEYERVEQELLTQWDAPLINDFLCMIAFGVSRKLLENQAGDAGLQLHSELLIGQGDIISAEPAKRIRAMATLAAADDSVVQALLSGNVPVATAALATIPALHAAYQSYLTKFGNRCLQELKLESPTLHDDPTSLLMAIGQMAQRVESTDSAQASMPENVDSSVSKKFARLFKRQPLKRWFVSKVMQWAKNRVRDRENLRFERTRVFGYARQIFLAMGERLTEQGYFASAREIFYLELAEIRALVDNELSPADLHQLLAQRIADTQIFSELSAPPNRFESRDGVLPDFDATAPAASAQITAQNQGDKRQGIGCCAGVVRAPVRVIDDPRTAYLEAGEIMVARFTDPGWITLFTNASGILVERGSLLSHSAIVARELGIPAIVAIDGVMEWLQTGDVVEMDGALGSVKRDA